MLRTAILLLEIGDRRPEKGELGINGCNQMYFNSGDPIRDGLPEYKNVQVVLPTIVHKKKRKVVIVESNRFTAKQLYAIMNQRVQHGDYVTYMVNKDGTPRYTTDGHVTLVPYKNSPYSREYCLDMLADIVNDVRKNTSRDISVEAWFDRHNTEKRKEELEGMIDSDEAKPDKIGVGT